METIEIISTVVAATATILAGVWFIIRKAQQRAVNDYRIDYMEKSLSTIAEDIPAIKEKTSKLDKLAEDIPAIKEKTNKLDKLAEDIPAIKEKTNKLDKLAEDIPAIKERTSKLDKLAEDIPAIKEKTSKLDKLAEDIPAIKEKTSKLDSLPCDDHRSQLHGHDMTIARMETTIAFLAKSVGVPTQYRGDAPEAFTRSHSPLRITPKGEEMMQRLGITQMFNDNWPRIKSLIDRGVQEKTPYDIDLFCIEQAVVYPEKFLQKEDIRKIKGDAYENGLTLTPYMKVLAVLSRDRYFRETGMNENQPWEH